MKNFILLALMFNLNISAYAETIESEFSLEGALELFKDAQNLEEFEKSLNDEQNYISNLDLNQDDETDYIKVIDLHEGDAHAIVLQIDINENEAQDIAVIEVLKTGDESAEIQIVGDSDIFGDDTIVEPYQIEATPNQKGGPSADYTFARVVINVWAWPSVRFIYRPNYRPYVSPWRYRYYPRYWKPWRPHPVNLLISRRPVFRLGFHSVPTRRFTTVHRVYAPKRRQSVTVKRTTVVRNKNGAVVKRKTTTTTVSKNRNNAVTKKTTTKKVHKNKNGAKKKVTRTKKVSRKRKNG